MENKLEEQTENEVQFPYRVISHRLMLIHTHFKNEEWFTPEQVAEKLEITIKEANDLLKSFITSLFGCIGNAEKDEWKYRVRFDIQYDGYVSYPTDG